MKSSFPHESNFDCITDFGVRTAILNTKYISRRWDKLNLGPLRDHVKSHHFLEKIDASRPYFHFFIQISWNNWQEITWTNLLDNDLGLLLSFNLDQIRLE